MAAQDLPADTFGDRFLLEKLPLPRLAAGYAVQMLGSDQLLDRNSKQFFSVRSSTLHCLFKHFEDAFAAASEWVVSNGLSPDNHKLAIVPVGFDPVLERHVLIYGVLEAAPQKPKYLE